MPALRDDESNERARARAVRLSLIVQDKMHAREDNREQKVAPPYCTRYATYVCVLQ